jgi:hypothetical protein
MYTGEWGDEGKLAISASMKRLIRAGQEMTLLKTEELAENEASRHFVDKLDVEISTWPSLFDNKITCTIDLKDYRLKEEYIAGSEDVRKALEQIEGENYLSLVDYWCVDWDSREGEFNPVTFLFRDKKGLPYTLEKEMDEDSFDGRTITIKVVDIFGNSSMIVSCGKLISDKK